MLIMPELRYIFHKKKLIKLFECFNHSPKVDLIQVALPLSWTYVWSFLYFLLQKSTFLYKFLRLAALAKRKKGQPLWVCKLWNGKVFENYGIQRGINALCIQFTQNALISMQVLCNLLKMIRIWKFLLHDFSCE